MKEIGKIISKYRKEKGLTQKQLGKKLNVSSQAISKWENNTSQPDIQTIQEMTKIFDISIAEFFDNENEDNEAYYSNDGYTYKAERSQSLSKKMLIYIISGLAILIFALSLIVFLVPRKLSSNQIYSKVDPSVFCIRAVGSSTEQAGSGFFINDSGLAVTNFHVIKNCTSSKIQLNNGKIYDVKKIVGCDVNKDIALIQIDIKKSKGVKLGNSNKIKVGDTIYAIGYPESFQLGSQDSTFTEGIISKISYDYLGNSYIQSTVDMTLGNSGGALIDKQGKVIGITTLMLTNGLVDYINLSIPINKIKEVKRDVNLSLNEYFEKHQEKTLYFYSDGKVIGQKSYISGEKIMGIKEPTKEGYTFDGWFTSTDFDTPFDFNLPLTDQECCYAKWTPNTYTIKFDLDDGMGEIDDIVATYDVEIDLPAITFEKAHYNFVGWKDSDKEIFYSINGKVKNLTRENNGTVVLKAVWQMQKYSITFDDNGADNGNMDDIELEYDQKVNIPTNTFTKVGYLFNGWLYNGKTYQNEEEISMLCESEDTITLTAQWKPITYTIRFEFEGQNSYEQKFTYDSRQELLPVGFVKEYFAFSGWFCPTKSLYFADQEEILNLSEEEGQILVFTAQFREFTYSIRYNPDKNVDLENCYIRTFRYSQEGNTDANIFSKTGYKFLHWIDDEEKIYSGRYVVEDHFTKWVGDPIFKLSDIDGDIINFYAVWEEITYTANYICNHKGEQYKVKIGEKTYEEEFVLGECPFSFDGYEFSHYHLPYDRTDNQYKPGQTVKRLTYDDGAYVYIEAILVPKEYTIVFDKNGATSGEMLPMTATFDSNVTLPENKFVKEGYTFLGWEFNETLYLTNEIGLPISTYTESITLKARWVENLKGKGTIDNPYTISSIQDLNNFAEITKVNQFENEYVVLTEDIDCKFTKLKSVNFAGTFDGKGYKLINVDYENGCLFEENSGIIENLAIENLKIEIVSDDANKNLYIAGLVKSNIGFISRCYVKGDINIQTAGNVRVFGLVASNTPHDYVYGQTKFCFTELNVEIRSELSINTCAIYGFGRGGNFIDYNYSIFSLTANLKNVENLYVDALGFKGSHSFAKANVNVNVDSVTNYDFTQTAKYYSDDSTIKLLIGGKSVPNIIQTTTASSNLKDKDWMEENLFDVKGVWIYDSSNFPTPSYTFQNVIDRQDQFNLLKNNLLFGEYILNCDIDLSENINFIILKNYGVFNGNGHIIRNYSAQEVAYKNLYALFETNYGIIKNLGIENINIELNARQGIIEGAGLVCENYGIINSCFVKGSLSFSNIDGDTIVGGIVAVSKGGKVLNSYSDVSVYICNTSNVLTSCYAGGIVATGEGNVENCYSKQNVNVYAHYASGTFSAFGISGAEGKVKNSFVLSNVSVVEYSSNGDFQAEGIGNDYENSFAYEWQKITRLGEDLSFGDKSYEELCSTIFLESLNFKAFISQEDLVLNNFNVWVFSQTNLPKLWFEE